MSVSTERKVARNPLLHIASDVMDYVKLHNMRRELLIMLILSLFTILFFSCRNQAKPRTIYWAGTLYVSEPKDSIKGKTLYLTYK